MNTRILITASALAFCTTTALADGHAGNTGYALAGDGKTLVVMANIAAPADVKIYDLADSMAAIAYRPVTGDLLGYSNGKIVTIDPMSGAQTDTKAKFMDDASIADDAVTAFDFNNKIDAVRAVSSAGDNLVYFPAGFGDGDEKANSVRRFTNLAYEEGDTNAGTTPQVFANAYTNAISGKKASGTFQYALDAETDSLVSLANNAGTLKTVGKVTVDGKDVDLAATGGFDIVSPAEGTDMAFAVLQMEGGSSAGLYTVDLSSGAATMLADLGMGGITGFAVSGK